MKILVACEFSGAVRDALIAKGHNAISCDLLPTDKPGPHFQGDVRYMLDKEWDGIIAHPPCTYLTLAGVRWLYTENGRWEKMLDGVNFLNMFLLHDTKRLAVENPLPHGFASDRIFRKYSQIIQPWQFGHPENKKTCLWLKGLDTLKETNNVKESMKFMTEKEKNKIHHAVPGPDRWKLRSMTYQGIANAMAEQWFQE